jgi:hypothetical protein
VTVIQTAVRAPERERDDGHPFGADEGELGVPAIVLVARLADLRAQPLGVGRELAQVGVEALRRDRTGGGDEQVDPERPLGPGADSRYL